ncbi:MAG: hypothetical protein UV46_C0015G0018 [Candidatus Gottesmanbacteria bacterium GW2011_GWC2_42_8]|nr:MAG: hypothetical protein UV46_C0015G0018 [Candidatus Gottesmanbacteria bacterium GW2011_GWC2_42_8]
MRKLFLAVSAFILSLVLLNIPSSGFAQEIFLAPSGYPDVVEQTEPAQLKIAPEYYPVPDRRPPHFSGENHDYSVVLRGNGEAVVTLKVALSNLNPDGSELIQNTPFRYSRLPDYRPGLLYEICPETA